MAATTITDVQTTDQPALLSIDGAVATITLNRPTAFNSINLAIAQTLEQLAAQIAADDTIHVVIIEGNGRAFCDDCSARYGVPIELVSGDDEARLAYRGARSALHLTAGRVLVADVGGGSVELAAGDGALCDSVQSLQLGFLRLAHAFPINEPGGVGRLARYVQLESEKARWQLGRFDTLLLSGGTARAIGKLLGGGIASASTAQVLELCEELAKLPPAALIARGGDRERATTLAAGAAVVSGLLAGFGQRELRISPRGLREGMILRELSQRATRAA